jgi:hypothetical protein
MKSPIDLQREGAAFMNVGSPDDLGPITAMIVIGKKMHVVKASSIYEVRLADDIDPQNQSFNPKYSAEGSQHWIGRGSGRTHPADGECSLEEELLAKLRLR